LQANLPHNDAGEEAMQRPERNKAGRVGETAFGRLARLCALFAILAYQPLAAFHFATDEAHLLHAATSFQVAAPDGGAHAQSGHSHGGHSHHHGQADPLCDFCILAGVSLPPLPAAPVYAAAESGATGVAPPASLRAEKRLRAGHPVRAPPPTV
jgi:hypothetical protein